SSCSTAPTRPPCSPPVSAGATTRAPATRSPTGGRPTRAGRRKRRLDAAANGSMRSLSRVSLSLLVVLAVATTWLSGALRAATFEVQRCEKFTDVGVFLQLGSAGQIRTLIVN